ncbi:uncharacterized protein ACLA_055750 [Aspergillus clavatus NRRL 1]|uniref:Uncharacterized protein n=1 Tax=Aspergillus clavatus (strain ATCC 1007 / CBS 513.65 / DSM 816 / NCTC 3887 / NRRL 1 / QM 1276 / 107) TaxID=344612 RepID=A1C9K3_ASPCL|nr:uncharacterized protein ACLA_055750 [Aspergillus clavatus NRRL 1]EAW13527.1 hypothetical protein ACLA_055750 [Aspergillus clavatus NRRL 1]
MTRILFGIACFQFQLDVVEKVSSCRQLLDLNIAEFRTYRIEVGWKNLKEWKVSGML